MSSIANSIEAIYAELEKTAAHEPQVRPSPALTIVPPSDIAEMLKVAAAVSRDYSSDVSLDEVCALLYGMTYKEASVMGRVAEGVGRLMGRGGKVVSEAAPAVPATATPDLSYAENLRSSLMSSARGGGAPPDELSELAARSLQPRAAAQSRSRVQSALQGESAPYVGSAPVQNMSSAATKGPPPVPAAATAKPPAAAQQPAFTPALKPAPPGKGPTLSSQATPAQAAATKGPPPAAAAKADDVGEEILDNTAGGAGTGTQSTGWKLPVGLGLAGAGGTVGAYNVGQQSAKEDAMKQRNLAFGAGLATGTVAPKMMQQAGKALSNFGAQPSTQMSPYGY